jgi:hypothetical protein
MNRRGGVRRTCCSRPAFQIWPHDVQRQYVDTFTALLVVVTFSDMQNGQASGATVASEDSDSWVYTVRLPALWIVGVAEPLFDFQRNHSTASSLGNGCQAHCPGLNTSTNRFQPPSAIPLRTVSTETMGSNRPVFMGPTRELRFPGDPVLSQSRRGVKALDPQSG